MRIGTNQSIRIDDSIFLVHAACEILKIHLMHNTNARRYYLEGIKSLHTPFYKLVAFLISRELNFHVAIERFFISIMINLD